MSEIAWLTEDGLRLTPEGEGYTVQIERKLPERLGTPDAYELPSVGTTVRAGDVLVAIELTKARVEFAAPADLEIAEAGTVLAGHSGFILRVRLAS